MRKTLEIFIYAVFAFGSSEKFGLTELLEKYLPAVNKDVVFIVTLILAVITLLMRLIPSSSSIKGQSQIGGKGNTQQMS